MNVYNCWHHGTSGYTCRLGKDKWLFVPQLGQISNRVHRNVELSELTFRDRREYRHEISRSEAIRNPGLLKRLRAVLFPPRRSLTIGGRLFTPDLH